MSSLAALLRWHPSVGHPERDSSAGRSTALLLLTLDGTTQSQLPVSTWVDHGGASHLTPMVTLF
jgi:hypothetical protein